MKVKIIKMNLKNITQKYLSLFPTDTSYNLMQRQTPNVLCSLVEIAGYDDAKLIHFNKKLSKEIGLGKIENHFDINFLNASQVPENITTYATAYAGYQFGNWAGQLGDGRAIYAGEIQNSERKTTEIQWKGAGATPYSRYADGRAVLRSSVREYLMSEAMHYLNIPTTRGLSISFTGENVLRDLMYSGNPKYEKGAVIIRTSESFLRFGHFELISAQKNYDLLKQLVDFTIENYFSEIQSEGNQKYLDWFKSIAFRTAELMVEWYRVGFTHGVMNTDNMSIIGQTIDYGPFSMLDEYQLSFTPNTTDLPRKRYAFGEQGKIAQWNLWQLGNALFPLIQNSDEMQKILDEFPVYFWRKHDKMLCKKFGFDILKSKDETFFTDWQSLMQDLKIDYTLFFHRLETFTTNAREHFRDIYYKDLSEEEWVRFEMFLKNYAYRLAENTISIKESKELMRANNPKFILKNYLLYECIQQVEKGNMEMFHKLFQALQSPYDEIYPEFTGKRPSKYDETYGCSALSCSS